MEQKRFTANEIVEAIRQERGFVSRAARRLGCSRMTVYRATEKYASVREAIEDAREDMKDTAEAKLYQQIDEGNTTALIFYLKTQAKDRGYVERQELAGVPDAPLGPLVVIKRDNGNANA